MSCIDCGGPTGELSPEMRRAKTRLGMPLTPPKRCPKCLWKSLETLKDDDGSEETGSNGQ